MDAVRQPKYVNYRDTPDSGLMNKNSKLITTREPGGSQLAKN